MCSTGFLLVWPVSFENKRLLYRLTPNTYLDHIWIYILCPSPFVTAMWISHQACQGFLHGKSSFFLLHWPCGCMRLLHFYLSCLIISDQASFMIGPLDLQSVDTTHVTKCPLWLTSIIWHSSLCFYNKPSLGDATTMQYHATSCYIHFWDIVLMCLSCVNHSDQAQLYQSKIHVNGSCVLPSSDVCC